MRGRFWLPWWCKNKMVLACLTAVILYGLLSTGIYSVEYSYEINCADPKTVWEYVADFSNMKNLNPTLRNFTILSDSGNYNNWQYEVEYTENLHNFPSILNTAKATYQVIPVNQYDYAIKSHHETCFTSSTCFYSRSEFKFMKIGHAEPRTHCVEQVMYQCPRILYKFCSSEVIFQRESIKYNLNKILCKK